MTAVPEFEICEIDVTGFEGWINRTDIEPDRVEKVIDRDQPIDCMWTIRVKNDWKVNSMILNFISFIKQKF